MPTNQNDRKNRLQLYGWVLFMVCSLFFIADGVAVGNAIGIIGGVLFLLGCIVFVIAFI